MIMIMKLQDQVSAERRRPTRVRSAPDWYGNPVLEIMLLDHDEPTNYEEAMMSPDSAKWLEAMKSEMGSMYENKVWTLVDLPDDRQAIENKWIFKRKTDADGNVTVYKARRGGGAGCHWRLAPPSAERKARPGSAPTR